MAAPSLVLYGAFLNYGTAAARRRASAPGAELRDQPRRDQQDRRASGLGQPSSAILPKEHWACDPATQNFYTYDPDKAKALLAEAGHPNGIEIETYGWADQLAMQRQEVHHLAARQGRHPRQAHRARAATGGAGLHGREEGRDVHQPAFGLSRPEPGLRGAVRQDGVAQRQAASSCRASASSSTRRWRRRTRTDPQGSIRQAARFVIEQALQLVQYISPARRRGQQEGEELPGQPARGAEVHRGLARGVDAGHAAIDYGRSDGEAMRFDTLIGQAAVAAPADRSSLRLSWCSRCCSSCPGDPAVTLAGDYATRGAHRGNP